MSLDTVLGGNIRVSQGVLLHLPRWPLPFRLFGLILLCWSLAFRLEFRRHLYAAQHRMLSRMYSLWKEYRPC